MKATELEFGFKDEMIEAPALWGARLIMEGRGEIEHRSVDLVWDRQSVIGEAETLKQALDGEPKGTGAIRLLLDHLTRRFRQFTIDPVEDETSYIDKTFKGVRFRGSPRKSHGYFYVTATLDHVGPTCDGCGTGGQHGTKTYPGLCQKCRDERTQEKRTKVRR